jgi:hypothetical protein
MRRTNNSLVAPLFQIPVWKQGQDVQITRSYLGLTTDAVKNDSEVRRKDNLGEVF